MFTHLDLILLQDVWNMQALETLCSLAASGATSVIGGNWQVFKHFVKFSEARVYLDTVVSYFFFSSLI